MDIRVFDLPTLNDDFTVIERRYNELESKFRNGEKLDDVEIDWMNTANTWLMTVWSN